MIIPSAYDQEVLASPCPNCGGEWTNHRERTIIDVEYVKCGLWFWPGYNMRTSSLYSMSIDEYWIYWAIDEKTGEQSHCEVRQQIEGSPRHSRIVFRVHKWLPFDIDVAGIEKLMVLV